MKWETLFPSHNRQPPDYFEIASPLDLRRCYFEAPFLQLLGRRLWVPRCTLVFGILWGLRLSAQVQC